MTVTAQDSASYLEALAVPDRRAALDVVATLLADGVPRQELLLDLVCASQREIGQRWQRGEWSVPQEHAATAINDVAVAVIMAGDASPAERGHLVVACVDDELHALPARVVAEVVQLGGWLVTYLGANTPASRLSSFLHELGPDAVALSCTVAMSLPKARMLIEAAREVGVPVVVGGAAFGPTERRAHHLGADGWAPDAPSLLAVLATLPVTTTPAPPLVHDGVEEHLALAERREEILADAFAELVRRFPPVATYDDGQTAHTRADLAYILDFVAASRYVDDETILFDLTDWLLEVLTSRGVPAAALAVGLESLGAAAADVPGAHRLLGAAATRIWDGVSA
jgi:methanogenic corrinoid protein MtbC1